ncbi:MAG TPA: hypothetical protein VGH56_03825, partial [Solirubrobacteraceae bacterium]
MSKTGGPGLAEGARYEFDVAGLTDTESGSGQLIGGHRTGRAAARASAMPDIAQAARVRATQLWSRAARRPRILIGAGCVLVVALTAITTVLGATGAIVDEPALFLTFRAVFCGGIVVAVLMLLARSPSVRMPALLVGLACCLAASGFTGIDSPGLFAIGRVAVSVAVAATIYVSLAYPGGWIEDHSASIAWRTMATALLVLTAANLLLSRVHPVAGPFVRCSATQCPPNPLVLIDGGAKLSMALSTTLAIVTGLSLIIAAILVERRWATSTRLQRRSL